MSTFSSLLVYIEYTSKPQFMKIEAVDCFCACRPEEQNFFQGHRAIQRETFDKCLRLEPRTALIHRGLCDIQSLWCNMV